MDVYNRKLNYLAPYINIIINYANIQIQLIVQALLFSFPLIIIKTRKSRHKKRQPPCIIIQAAVDNSCACQKTKAKPAELP